MKDVRPEAAPPSERRHRRVTVVPAGLQLDDRVLPLHAGSVHYWRLDPRDWKACLEATKAMGLGLVDVYVPWSVHEVAPGVLELGATDPQRDVARFLRLAHEIGLYAIVRPGPHINAELTHFGIPDRIIWDPACQARSPKGNPVLLPMLPRAFPVPSYASEAFLDEVTRFFRLLAPALAPLRYPDGPIVLLQIDNEGSLYFRDGAYDQDYHPDAVALYRKFLRDKYVTMEALNAAYGRPSAPRDSTPPPSRVAPAAPAPGEDAPRSLRAGLRESTPPPPPSRTSEEVRFGTILPPERFEATTTDDVARHLDWCEFHEHLLATAIDRFGRALATAGLGGLPTTHNLPIGQEATPLNAARVGRAVDFVGLDYYHTATERSRRVIAGRTSELAVRCEGLRVPPFACEMGAGFPPFFPPLEERDSAFTVLAALAYGLRGFNVYMAVERDRWIGAPIDPRGRARPFAAFWRRLCHALETTGFASLRRATPVRILTPRSERRLLRAMHAFGPLTGTVFSVLGASAHEAAREDDFGLGYPIAIEGEVFTKAFEQALESRGVAFAHVGGEDREIAISQARWVLVATSGGLHPGLFHKLVAAAEGGTTITLGPRAPAFDGALRPLATPFDLDRLRPQASGIPLVVGDDPTAADAAVARAVEELDLPSLGCDPDGIFATVHEDDGGVPRVLFVLNPTTADVVARVRAPGVAARATDLLEASTFDRRRDAFEVRMKPKTVRMLALG